MLRNIWTHGLVLTAVLMLLLAGCDENDSSNTAAGGRGPAAQGNSASAEQVTIHMMHSWPADSSPQQYRLVTQIVEAYEQEHPNVNIKQEVLENEQYKNKLKVLSASNELPDVGITWAAGFIEPYVKGDLFAPLDDILGGEQLKDKFVAGTTEAYKVDGITYALPIELNICPVYYNKDIFERYDLQVPSTYEEFKEVVKTLADAGVAPIALGNKDRWTGSIWYMYLADRLAGSETLSKATSAAVSFDDPGLIRAAAEVQNLVNMKAFNPGYNGLSNEEGKLEFTDEKAAMYLTGTWELPNFTANPDIPQEFKDKVGFFKFPTVDGGKGDINSWVGGPGVGLFVAEASRVEEEAKAFVEYFVSHWGEASVTTAGVIPATKVDTSDSRLPQLYVQLLDELNNASSITLYADVQMKPTAAQVHLDMIQALFGEAVTPEQFAVKNKEAVEKSN
ncbi:extracellular solute-binding protein [Paenibacillus tengchongensis]|uniref:extracellular solute-binding protein n=1 Tax=Paenibacillus tengchongensis TaxID=2608684 RepID=UPI00124E99F1|nr:extracellular solute-binding protein [Paenibacillus tengchongensis]